MSLLRGSLQSMTLAPALEHQPQRYPWVLPPLHYSGVLSCVILRWLLLLGQCCIHSLVYLWSNHRNHSDIQNWSQGDWNSWVDWQSWADRCGWILGLEWSHNRHITNQLSVKNSWRLWTMVWLVACVLPKKKLQSGRRHSRNRNLMNHNMQSCMCRAVGKWTKRWRKQHNLYIVQQNKC